MVAANRGIPNPNPPLGGEIVDFNMPDGLTTFKLLRERVTPSAAAASITLSQKIPANSRVLASGLVLIGAATLVTAVNIGLGPAALPTQFLMSGSTGVAHAVTANTKFGPNFQVSPGMIFQANASSVAVGASSTAEATHIFSLAATGQAPPSIPANTLKVGDVIRIRFKGTIGWGTDGTLTIRVKLGTDIYLATVITPVDADVFGGDVDIQVTAIGATGSARSGGRTYIGTADSTPGAADKSSFNFLGATALDTTAAVAPIITAQFSTSQAAHTSIVDIFTVEIVRNSQNQIFTADTTVLISPVTKAGLLTGTIVGDMAAYLWLETRDAFDDSTVLTTAAA